jgi:hypothetical protein
MSSALIVLQVRKSIEGGKAIHSNFPILLHGKRDKDHKSKWNEQFLETYMAAREIKPATNKITRM